MIEIIDQANRLEPHIHNSSTAFIDTQLNSSIAQDQHLDVNRRSAALASCQSRGWQTRPNLRPKDSDVREPTGTAIDGHERRWWGRCWS